MNHPRMTSDGRRIAFFIALLIVFMLPKRVECGYPRGECERFANRERCIDYEIEPLGFYLIEYAARRDVGFAYKSGTDCR